MILHFTRIILSNQPKLLKYWVRLFKTYWREISDQGHRLGKGIIITQSWIPGIVLSLNLFWTALWAQIAWTYGFQYGRYWSRLSNIRSTRFYFIKLENYVRPRNSPNVIPILWSKIEYDLLLSLLHHLIVSPFKLFSILFIFWKQQH